METEHYAFILVIDGKYWTRLCERTRQGKETNFFVRGNAVAPLDAKKLFFYVKKPKMQVLGVADFVERIIGEPQDLWNLHGAQSIFDSQEEYNAFKADRKQVTFIRFNNFAEIVNPKSKEALTKILGPLVWFKARYINQKIAKQLTN